MPWMWKNVIWNLVFGDFPKANCQVSSGLLSLACYCTSHQNILQTPSWRPDRETPVLTHFCYNHMPSQWGLRGPANSDGHLTSLSIRVYLQKAALEQAGRESGGFCGHLMTQFSLGCGKWEILRWWHLAIGMKRLRPRCFISIHSFAASSNARQHSRKPVSSLCYISGPQRTGSA